MKLSISQVLAESWDDFKKLIVNPGVLILFFIFSALSLIPDLIPNKSDKPLLLLVVIPYILLLLFLHTYIIKSIYNIKKAENQNIFSEIFPLFTRYLLYTLRFTGIFMLVTLVVLIPGIILYVIMGEKAVWVWFLVGAAYIPVVLYLYSRLFFYTYLIIIERDNTPLATSWAMTKAYFWGIILLALVLVIIFSIIAIAIGMIMGIIMLFTHLPENVHDIIMSIILFLLNIIAVIYMTITFLNTFLFCRTQSKVKAIKEEILAGNE